MNLSCMMHVCVCRYVGLCDRRWEESVGELRMWAGVCVSVWACACALVRVDGSGYTGVCGRMCVGVCVCIVAGVHVCACVCV